MSIAKTVAKASKPWITKAATYAMKLLEPQSKVNIINSTITKEDFKINEESKKTRMLKELKDNPKLGPQLGEGGERLRMGGQTSAIRADWKKNK